jgi:hypothetical protein
MDSLLLHNECIVMCDVDLRINSLINATFVNVILQLQSQHHSPVLTVFYLNGALFVLHSVSTDIFLFVTGHLCKYMCIC